MVNHFRASLRKAPLMGLLTIALLMRSLIAPGFMLETSNESPSGLAVVFCEGLNGVDVLNSMPTMHHHHHGDSSDQNQQTSYCDLSSISKTFINYKSGFSAPTRIDVAYYYIDNTIPALPVTTLLQSKQARAPPAAFFS